MKRVLLVGVCLLLPLTIIGCGQNGAESVDSPLVLEQIDSGITAQLTVSQNPVSVMEETVLTLALHDADGQPVQAAVVHYDLTMPGMTMPPNQLDANEQADGVYTAQAIFTMAGDWRCNVAVTLSDNTPVAFAFDLKAQ
ncbi:MAG: FixH family protein [Anaerolineaceae bacterium]|nr:FixH family protein [Anaerolineaceae bacterium]